MFVGGTTTGEKHVSNMVTELPVASESIHIEESPGSGDTAFECRSDA